MESNFKILIFLFCIILAGCVNHEPKKEIVELSFSTNVNIVIEAKEFDEGYILNADDLPNVEVENKVFIGWFYDENYKVRFEEEELYADLILYGQYVNYTDMPEYLALETIKIPSSTYVDITLPNKVSRYDIIWISNKEDVLDSTGKCKDVSLETEVTLSATIINNSVEFFKTYTIKVLPFPYEEKAQEIIREISFYTPSIYTINLSTSFNNGFTGRWESSNEDAIDTLGNINRQNTDVKVTLTLTLSRNDFTKKTTFDFIVPKYVIDVDDPQYFINSLLDKDIDVEGLIMNYNEIVGFNNTVLTSSGANVVNLEVQDIQVNKTYVTNLINKYNNMDRYNVYDNGKIINYIEKQNILDNRNIDGISDIVDIQYAVSVKHTSLRSYPTDFYSQSDAMDRFQETGFSVGIPMIVYHKSLDSNWYYVRMYNYDGWVHAEDIALCSRVDFIKYNKNGNFIVVLDSKIEIENQLIRMGYSIPYSSKDEYGYNLDFPTRNLEGTLEIKNVYLEKSESISDGYIDYNYTNLLNQAYKLIGTQYSWGDKIIDGLDCSSTQAAIYNCFGFILGRNTSNQWKTDNYGESISNITNEKLKEFRVGTLLYTSGHVLMYIGTDEDGNCWLLHNTSTGNICKVQSLNSYGTSSINNVLIMHN